MAVLKMGEVGRLHVGQTGAALVMNLMEDDETTPMDLTGFSGRIVFWYAGTDPHYVGQVAISNASLGQITYDFSGSEAPTSGNLLGQLETVYPGTIDQTTQEWVVKKYPPFKWKVV